MTDSKISVDYDLLAKTNKYQIKHPAAHTPKELMEFFKFSGFILDLGTGSGRYSHYLKEKGFDIVGLDISLEQLKKSPLKKLVCCNADKLPFKDKVFDCVLCSEVLEHLFQPEICLKEVRRILKDGGFACFTTPCFNFPFRGIVIPLYRRLAGIKLEPNEHIQVFNSRNLLNMIRNYFKIEEVRYVDFTAILKWRFACGYSLDNLLSKVCKKISFLKYFSGSIFIKTKVPKDSLLPAEKEIERKITNWDRYWKGFKGQTLIGKFYQSQARRIIYHLLNNIILDKESAILDFGCGRGRTLSYFKEWGFKNIKGLDVSSEALEICQKRGFEINKDVFLVNPDNNNFEDREFSLVFSEGLLEHYQEFGPLVKQMVRLSARYIILVQPNHFPFMGRLLHLLTELFIKEKQLGEISHPISNFILKFEEEGFKLKKRRDTFFQEFAVLLLERKDV